MKFRPEVKPFLLASFVFGVFIYTIAKVSGASNGLAFFLGLLFGGAGTGYMLFFFRDPEIVTPAEPGIVVAAANGKLAKIVEMYEKDYLKQDTIRISIFLSLFDVHVNRFPIGGFSTFLGYFPGKRLFTFDEKSSDVNQHNAILVRNEETSCLIRQIVGPVCRRVVYWLREDKTTTVKQGDRFGMMKFGSRLDMYFPKDDIEMVAKIGDQVTAGETIIARIVKKGK
ncbi:MAG TPA: phosphatidylserine decarboxylase [Aminobacteriaceae bacterium]|jgi:phosphatidylserine decarboxylase|nr:phosphatidylserine decarboxylase [Synergistaceae bacterium]NLD97252.1 phosphatidylserine decarboxylase family protein [Synergistaceae bacterium]HRV98284.1 phosphatidylserine decarboxylase [Aminobacteriaceae bacterium]